VIGGGVVGLSVARSCAIQTKASILLIEKEDTVASGVSARNSGLGCTGYDAPIGSLERRLLRRSIRRHQHLYRSFGLTHSHVRKCGSLVVAWSENELEKLPEILQENRDAGDLEAILLTKEELKEYEPKISERALGAVFCPYESVVEPWLVPMGYAESARLNGVTFQLGQNQSIDLPSLPS
jgi:glycerol-3-phosphate dehydrogenase